MATITIRRLDEGVKSRLRIRAAENGHSMEEEARAILEIGLRKAEEAEANEPWWERLHRTCAHLGGLPDPPPRIIEPDRDIFGEG